MAEARGGRGTRAGTVAGAEEAVTETGTSAEGVAGTAGAMAKGGP